ncbi:MAG: thiamine phosphate synthase [Rhodospirillaceae bacterium]|nr:thiamine phosphate synthase [Rhodospirillaceae bacterium]MBL6942155.1 thiamine phosphate synthase [Rhodospirillales bacterium]
MTDFNRTQLYLITPPKLDLSSFPDILARTLDAGRVGCLQLRLKDTPEEDIVRTIDALKPIAQERGVAFLLNDDPTLAARTGCDGVHVGQQDASYEEAREAVGTGAIVGVTCHDSRHLAMEAAEQGADYVAFGAFFPTATKTPKAHPDPEILNWWSKDMTVPVVAIGGISVENCPPLISAGADFLAVVAGVWDYAEGPEQAVIAFNRLFKETPVDP